MSKITQIKISNFSGGISDSPRKDSSSEFILAKMFDVFTDPQRLIPYRSLEADTSTSVSATDLKQYFVRDFKYASASDKLYGLGQTGAGNTKIVYKAVSISGNWTIPASSEGNGAVKNGCFVEFKDYMWGFQGTNQIFKWGLLSGTPSITNSVATVATTITSVADGVIAADANLYLAYNNAVVRVAPDTTTITDVAKTVPANYKITSLANYGNYLAIGCSPISTFNGVSKVFLWNLSSDLFAETIDWGEGELRVLEFVEGMLVGVTDRYLNSANGAGKGSMIIQVYSGGVAQVVKEVFTKKLTGKSIPLSKAVRNNRLFWAAKIMTNDAGTEYVEGLWSFGRKNNQYPWALSLDIIDENVDTDGIEAFGIAGNYFYITHSNDGSVDKTNDAATYAFTSSLETQILNFGDADTDKVLKSLKVSFAPLVSGQALTVKMKKDSDSAWTTIGTFNTVGETSRTFLNIESTGLAFSSGKEIRFLIESTGGLEITGWTATANITSTL
jgi:hypothetical protein